MAGGRVIFPFARIYSKHPPRDYQTFFPSLLGASLIVYYHFKQEYLVQAETASQFWNRTALYGQHKGHANHKWKHSKFETSQYSQ